MGRGSVTAVGGGDRQDGKNGARARVRSNEIGTEGRGSDGGMEENEKKCGLTSDTSGLPAGKPHKMMFSRSLC